MSNEATDRLESLPPSAKLVYKILEYEGPELTQEELAEETLLPQRTVRNALYELDDMGLVEDRPNDRGDARAKLYSTVK